MGGTIVFITIILLGIIIAWYIKIRTEETSKKEELHRRYIQNLSDRKAEYYKRSKNVTVPENCDKVNIKIRGDCYKVSTLESFCWINSDILYFFPTNEGFFNNVDFNGEMEKDVDKKYLDLLQIDINLIRYFANKGGIQYQTEVHGGGGGGTSIKGAVVGGILAGSTGAIIGSRNPDRPVYSETVKHDDRVTILEYYDKNNNLQFIDFTYDADRIFESLIPDKRYDLVLASQSNNNSNDDDAEKIKKFAELKNSGIITEEEFELKKKQILNL